MVGIIQFLPPVPTFYPSNVHNLKYKPPFQQITLPTFFTTVKNLSQNVRVNSFQTKQLVGRCPCEPSRLLDVSKAPYSLHRKVMYQELVRRCPITVDMSRKNKQQRNINKDTSQITTGTEGINTTSETSFSGVDVQSSCLFDTLSKHVTVKPEPLRPTNSFAHSSTNTSTSWQRYWASTHTQRRRQEANDPEPIFYRPKCEQPILTPTHFVLLRDSPFPNSELNSNSRTPLTPPSSCSPNKLSMSATPDKQLPLTKEDDINQGENQASVIELASSIFIPSTMDIDSSMIESETSTIVPSKRTDEEDEKYLTEQSFFLSSSHFKSDSEIIEEVANAQNKSIVLPTKVYELSLPSVKPKNKKSLSRRKTRSKSLEKKREEHHRHQNENVANPKIKIYLIQQKTHHYQQS